MLSNVEKRNGVYIFHDTEFDFSELYIATRRIEKRYYTDNDVAELPQVSKNNIHYKEWQLRQKSTARIIKYLQAKKKALKVLDIGCGNGWFSNCLSTLPNGEVYAIDVNLKELTQASRVFQKSNCKFIYGDVFKLAEAFKDFDIITLNACVQYFKDFPMLMSKLTSMLSSDGEIHIIDSPFYNEKNVSKAIEETRLYYEKVGVPEMKNHYYHHRYDVLKSYNYTLLYLPKNKVLNKLFRINDTPFPWIKITVV